MKTFFRVRFLTRSWADNAAVGAALAVVVEDAGRAGRDRAIADHGRAGLN